MSFDLGIEGRSAIVCGSSAGLGQACAAALAKAGVDVLLNGRSAATLNAAADALERQIGRPVSRVVADITTSAGRDAVLAQCPTPDILINNGAGPPPGNFEDWNDQTWHQALAENMITPIMMIRATLSEMRRRRWGRIINITSAAVKAPLPLLGLSNGARAGLTGFIAGLAREVAKDGVTINNLLPGSFNTRRLRDYAAQIGRARGVDADVILTEMSAANPTGRVGRPEEFGATCAFLASDFAGYITGQNVLLDGGAYSGTL